MSKEIKPLLPNGRHNPAWIEQWLEEKGGERKYAVNALCGVVRKMEEPPLATKSGGPNPVWITWYQTSREISRNVARNICLNKIKGTYTGSKQSSEWLERPGIIKKWELE